MAFGEILKINVLLGIIRQCRLQRTALVTSTGGAKKPYAVKGHGWVLGSLKHAPEGEDPQGHE